MGTVFTLLAGRLIDGSGSPAARNVLVRIDDGVISYLDHVPPGGPADSSAPFYTDLSDCTIIPALVDSHVHLTLSGTLDPLVRRDQLHYPFERNVPLMDKRIDKYLALGILALRDGGDRSGDTLHYKLDCLTRRTGVSSPHGSPYTDVDNETTVPPAPAREPFVCLKTPGSAWRANGRYGSMIGNPPEPGSSLPDSILRRTDPIDHIKIINSGLNSLSEFGKETPPQFNRDELRAAVAAARQRGLNTMVHANGTTPVADAVNAGCTSIEHGYFMGVENMRRMADHRTFWVPTAYAMKAIAEHSPSGSVESQMAARNLDHQLEQISRARSMDIPVALGTDAGGFGLHHAESLIQEFKLLMTAGYSAEEAVRCSSLEGARLLGIESEIGTLRVGMPATFVVLDGHPSLLPDSLRTARAVYVRGVPVHIKAVACDESADTIFHRQHAGMPSS